MHAFFSYDVLVILFPAQYSNIHICFLHDFRCWMNCVLCSLIFCGSKIFYGNRLRHIHDKICLFSCSTTNTQSLHSKMYVHCERKNTDFTISMHYSIRMIWIQFRQSSHVWYYMLWFKRHSWIDTLEYQECFLNVILTVGILYLSLR